MSVATKLNRTHTAPGDRSYVLPCLARSERDVSPASGTAQAVSVEDSMSMVHASVGRNRPASRTLLSEVAIVARLAEKTFPSEHPGAAVPWAFLREDYARIRDAIAETLPDLFSDYNARVGKEGGFYLGNAARERRWQTASGRATFTVASLPDLALPVGQLRLMTVRSHDQYNTTVYGLNDRYRGIRGTREVLFMNYDDIRARGLVPGDRVNIRSMYKDGRVREVEGFEVVPYEIPTGCCAGYFPELNPLVSLDVVATTSNTPVSKFVPVEVFRP